MIILINADVITSTVEGKLCNRPYAKQITEYLINEGHKLIIFISASRDDLADWLCSSNIAYSGICRDRTLILPDIVVDSKLVEFDHFIKNRNVSFYIKDVTSNELYSNLRINKFNSLDELPIKQWRYSNNGR